MDSATSSFTTTFEDDSGSDMSTAAAVHLFQRWLQSDYGHSGGGGGYGGTGDYDSDGSGGNSNPPIRSSHHDNSRATDQDTYEFIAFVLWYLFLVMCCVIPTCCAYRRRRLVEARLAQQQSRLAQQQFDMQQQNGGAGPGGATRPNFLLFDQLHHAGRRNSERIQSLRTEKLGEELKETTMTLSQDDIEETPNQPTPAGRIPPAAEAAAAAAAAATPTAPSADQDDDMFYGEDAGALVHLPADGINANRTVPCICAICLCPYEDGERVSWSPESNCQHAFHTDCIIPWLAKKQEQKCPVCRQDYCAEVSVEDELMQEEHARAGELFLDSFALALSYARAQSVRNWEEMSQPSAVQRSTTATNHHAIVRTNITSTGNNNNTTVTTTTTSAPTMSPAGEEEEETAGQARNSESSNDNNNNNNNNDTSLDEEMGGGGGGAVEMVETPLSSLASRPVEEMQMVDDDVEPQAQVEASSEDAGVAVAAAAAAAAENDVEEGGHSSPAMTSSNP